MTTCPRRSFMNGAVISRNWSPRFSRLAWKSPHSAMASTLLPLSATAAGAPVPTPIHFTSLSGSSPPEASSARATDRKSTRLNSSHGYISYAVFCLKKKNKMHFGSQAGRLPDFHIHYLQVPGRDHCAPVTGMNDFAQLNPYALEQLIKVFSLEHSAHLFLRFAVSFLIR